MQIGKSVCTIVVVLQTSGTSCTYQRIRYFSLALFAPAISLCMGGPQLIGPLPKCAVVLDHFLQIFRTPKCYRRARTRQRGGGPVWRGAAPGTPPAPPGLQLPRPIDLHGC